MFPSSKFNREDFVCKCGKCGFDTVDAELLDVLNEVRSHFNHPIIINSGCRCPSHNESEGGAEKSLHLQGKAADIRFAFPLGKFCNEDIHDYLVTVYPDKYGIAIEGSFVHIDVRSTKARWSY